MYNADKDIRNVNNISAQIYMSNTSHLKKHKKTNTDSTQKCTYWLGWKLPIHYTTQNILSIWNQQPSHISKQKFKSTIICWGPKLNNTKKSSSSTITEGEVQVHLLGQKHSTHGYWKTTQYIEIHKAKSFFTPNAFVHNIISNSAAPIDTQITKNILTTKSLRNCSNHYQT